MKPFICNIRIIQVYASRLLAATAVMLTRPLDRGSRHQHTAVVLTRLYCITVRGGCTDLNILDGYSSSSLDDSSYFTVMAYDPK